MGKLTENLFGARKAAGYKDRCVHCDSKKYVPREGAHRERTQRLQAFCRREAGWGGAPPARRKIKGVTENRPELKLPGFSMLFSGRGRWALLTDLCCRTRAVCAAEGLAFIFLIIRSCILSRKFLLKIVYSSSSAKDARKCRFNPNRVYFKGTLIQK